ncbi:MAG TPA: hypothetical protein VIK11_12140 [Tepidiformaceae bacterium]
MLEAQLDALDGHRVILHRRAREQLAELLAGLLVGVAYDRDSPGSVQ